MAGGKGKIHEHPNWGKGNFKTNPQNINSTGQNRKSFASINKSMLEKGIELLSKKDFVEAYAIIFNSTEDELKEMSKDTNIPMVFKLIIMELVNVKTRSKALSDYRDYLFGKAETRTDITTKGEAIAPIIISLGKGIKPPEEEETV